MLVPDERAVSQAAEVIAAAEVVLVCAGAGMGVDSGLPDFRGDAGFWQAYPPYARLGLSFVEMADPAGFRRDPELAWGFYGHRRHLYRRTRPHSGFEVLRRWMADAPGGGFVFTSNVDGQFQRAGFPEERVAECHGTIHVDQCLDGCGQPPWDAEPVEVEVDESTMRAVGPVPRCRCCGALARPNVLMFGDGEWEPARTGAQQRRLAGFLESVAGRSIAVVECGAGTAVPTVRRFSETLVRRHGAALIRINPREPDVPPGQLGIAHGAEAALAAIAAALGGSAISPGQL